MRRSLVTAATTLALLAPAPAWAQQSDTATAGMETPAPTPSATPTLDPNNPDYCSEEFRRKGTPVTASASASTATAGDPVTYAVTFFGPVNRVSAYLGSGYQWRTPTERGPIPTYPNQSAQGFAIGPLAEGESRTVSVTYTPTGNAKFSWSGAVYCGPSGFHGDVFGANPTIVNVAPRLTLTAVRNAARNYTFSGPASRPGQLLNLYRVNADGTEVLTSQVRAGEGSWSIRRQFLGSGRFGFVIRTGRDMANAPGASSTRTTVIH